MARRSAQHVSSETGRRSSCAPGVAFTEHVYDYVEHGGTADRRASSACPSTKSSRPSSCRTSAQPLVVLMRGDHVGQEPRSTDRLQEVEPCTTETAQRHSGYQVGGTSPFGTRKRRYRCSSRRRLPAPRIYINGGQRGCLVGIDPACLTDCSARSRSTAQCRIAGHADAQHSAGHARRLPDRFAVVRGDRQPHDGPGGPASLRLKATGRDQRTALRQPGGGGADAGPGCPQGCRCWRSCCTASATARAGIAGAGRAGRVRRSPVAGVLPLRGRQGVATAAGVLLALNPGSAQRRWRPGSSSPSSSLRWPRWWRRCSRRSTRC